jgi:hypothetical protein
MLHARVRQYRRFQVTFLRVLKQFRKGRQEFIARTFGLDQGTTQTVMGQAKPTTGRQT